MARRLVRMDKAKTRELERLGVACKGLEHEGASDLAEVVARVEAASRAVERFAADWRAV